MIVRDEQDNLPKCLSSVAGLFDEIVVQPGLHRGGAAGLAGALGYLGGSLAGSAQGDRSPAQ